jgi:hypothetical protein
VGGCVFVPSNKYAYKNKSEKHRRNIYHIREREFEDTKSVDIKEI